MKIGRKILILRCYKERSAFFHSFEPIKTGFGQASITDYNRNNERD